MNLESGGKQPLLRDGWYYESDGVQLIHQPMKFSTDDSVPFHRRGKAKGIKIVLEERGLWPYNTALRLDCQTKKSSKEHHGISCCARQLLSQQPDFKSQKSRLQEEIEARGHLCLFFPKYHCELNWMEYRWGRSKWWARKHCEYKWKALLENVPKSLDSVTERIILRHYCKTQRIMRAYRDGIKYGTEQFTNTVYKSHRRVSIAQELQEDELI